MMLARSCARSHARGRGTTRARARARGTKTTGARASEVVGHARARARVSEDDVEFENERYMNDSEVAWTNTRVRRGRERDGARERARESRTRTRTVADDDEDEDDDDVVARAFARSFLRAFEILRVGLPFTGGLALWAVASARAGWLSSSGANAALGVAVAGAGGLVFALASCAMSGFGFVFAHARRIFGPSRSRTMSRALARRRAKVAYEDVAEEEEEDWRRATADARRRVVADGNGAFERDGPQARVSKSFSFSDWTPEVPVVDPRLPGRWGGREEESKGDPNAWGTHRTPADFRRESMDQQRNVGQKKGSARMNDGDRPYGPSEWKSRAAYKQTGERDNGEIEAEAEIEARDDVIRKFEPTERLLPRTLPKPKHGYISTETLIAMGGASLETHIKSVNARGSSEANHRERRRGAATSSFNFSSGSNLSKPPSRSASLKIEDDDNWSDEFTRRARERFERNLTDAVDDAEAAYVDHRRASEFPGRSSDFTLRIHRNDDDDDDDVAVRRLKRTR